MAKFTEVPQYFLERAALQFLGNLAHHFHAPVEDRDFFDPLKCVYSPPDCETVLRVAFSKRELEEMVDEDDLRLHIPRTFSALWHESQARQRMQAVVEEMAAVMAGYTCDTFPGTCAGWVMRAADLGLIEAIRECQNPSTEELASYLLSPEDQAAWRAARQAE